MGAAPETKPGHDRNLWRETARERVTAAPLGEDATADLVIIGGGFTGCSAALHAAERGLSVRLLEAETFAHGGSGRNVGLVNAGLWLPPEEIVAQLGEEAGAKLNQILAGAPDLVFSLIERHGIDCEAVRNGTLHCAHSPAGFRDLENRHRQLAAMGAPVTLLPAEAAKERTGAAHLHGALHDARAGTIQPLAYCMGLARAAQQAGAVLHERSPARAAAQAGGVWRVETETGSVSAKALLLATNAYHGWIDGLTAPKAVQVCYFQMATRPLTRNLRATILPGGEGCWDTAAVMSSFRMGAAGRLIVGGIGALDHAGSGVHLAWAKHKLGELFPHLSDQPLDHAWFGRIAMTADHLPKVVRLGANAYAIFGYSGRGIGPGTVFGRAAATVFAGGSEDGFPVVPRERHSEAFAPLKRRYYEFGATLVHAMTRLGRRT